MRRDNETVTIRDQGGCLCLRLPASRLQVAAARRRRRRRSRNAIAESARSVLLADAVGACPELVAREVQIGLQRVVAK